MLRNFSLLVLAFGTSSTASYADNLTPEEFLNSYFTDKYKNVPNIALAEFDLNNDKKNDLVVYLKDKGWCGSGGCTTFIFENVSNTYRFVSKTTIVNKPISVSAATTSNWNNILVRVRDVGIVALEFDGSQYSPNPSILPPASEAEIAAARVIIE